MSPHNHPQLNTEREVVEQLRSSLAKVEEDNKRKNGLLSEIRRRLTGVAEREADLEEVGVGSVLPNMVLFASRGYQIWYCCHSCQTALLFPPSLSYLGGVEEISKILNKLYL